MKVREREREREEDFLPWEFFTIRFYIFHGCLLSEVVNVDENNRKKKLYFLIILLLKHKARTVRLDSLALK